MTQHHSHLPTPEPDLKELTLALKIMALELATLALSHPTTTQAVREAATKKMKNQPDPSDLQTSTLFTDMPGQHESTGTHTTLAKPEFHHSGL